MIDGHWRRREEGRGEGRGGREGVSEGVREGEVHTNL